MRFACLFLFPFAIYGATAAQLLESTRLVRAMEPQALRSMVPERSGLYFVGCPNCNAGRQEEKLAWTPERPGEVYCKYCNHRYPSAKYPMDHVQEVVNPRGEKQAYRYWQDASGYRYFFEARRDDLVKEYLAARTRDLAELYALQKDPATGERAVLLLTRFAEVFPGWCYHYDYPFRPKEVYSGAVPTNKLRSDFRTARWNWWGYKDIPNQLVQAYDYLRKSGLLEGEAAERIERDLLRNAADEVLSNPESNSNMSPSMWTSLIRLGKAIGEPRYVEEPAGRLKRFLDGQFLYDGSWHEGTPSYHAQTIGGVANVLRALGEVPALAADVERSQAALMKMRLPDGRFVPVHDTWWFDKREPLTESVPYLLPALGHAMLGGGKGAEQVQFNLTWSGGYGHQHLDGLSLLLFAQGRELLSDLGYTHTRQRAWATSTVAHNSVVIDGKAQASGSVATPTDGNLLWFDVSNPRLQSVSVDGRRSYEGVAKTYRRTLMVVESSFAIDIFEVEGGRTHDYFLHGDADASGTVEVTGESSPMPSLAPAPWVEAPNGIDVGWKNGPYWAYGYLRDLRSWAGGGEWKAVLRSKAGGAVVATFLAEPGSRLVTGVNPAVRGAKESDGELDTFSRPFAMLRHEAAGGRSRFVTVLEPVGASGARIEAASRRDLADGGIAVTVTRAGRTERIEYHGSRPTVQMTLASVEGDAMVLSGTAKSLPAPREIVRVVTADGWVYPFTIISAERTADGARVRVAERLALHFDSAARRLALESFPQRQHAGVVVVDWLAR